jgi:hypothetical protein
MTVNFIFSIKKLRKRIHMYIYKFFINLIITLLIVNVHTSNAEECTFPDSPEIKAPCWIYDMKIS